jgi:hypothetical protein
MSEQESVEFVNQVGQEAYELIINRLAALGELPLRELLPSVVGATNVCLANVLRVVIEPTAAADRAAVAEQLVASSTRQLRGLLEPIIAGPQA